MDVDFIKCFSESIYDMVDYTDQVSNTQPALQI